MLRQYTLSDPLYHCFTKTPPILVIGYSSLSLCLLAEALLQYKYLGSSNRAGLGACIFFIYLYILLYQFIDAPSFVWAAEIFPTTIRAKGLGLTLFAYFVGTITYTTPGALAFKNISWHMYLLYGGLCLISGVIVYFFIPETKQLPIEELGALFGDEVVVRLTEDGHGILEDNNLTINGKIEDLALYKRVIRGEHVEVVNPDNIHIR